MPIANINTGDASVLYVKDIRKFREFYRSNIKRTKDPDRDPHFAGEEIQTGQGSKFGLWEMFNGPGSIDNKLTTILNIAGDSQAIYEFMQNAVDADSKNFYLAKYGTDASPYLIVLNDGKYFSLESIVSILSIGVSSKYRNPDNIGQFGVGFKLAHRLIGADNSIKELLEDNKGPILFSWSNNELVDLVNKETIAVTEPQFEGLGKDAVSKVDVPWLFKIVATNFPCLTNDPVLDPKGRSVDALFTGADMEALKGAAKLCIEQCKNAFNFKTGTLLVIPLHPAKVEHVIGKIPKGLEVAATIISRRSKKEHDLRTQIETEELIPELLNAESWELSEKESSGMLGNEQVKIAELMFLYADPFYTDPFKGKPQFYRYFPMSLEQHGFRFAIHSNALTLSSARTELQENDSNKFLFSQLIPRLELKLQEYALIDSVKFSNLYASILFSNRSENSDANWMQGRHWLEDSFWNPLMNILINNVPIKTATGGITLSNKSNQVLIKNSNLPIEKWYDDGKALWFLWDEKTEEKICLEGKHEEKLGLLSVSLVDVLLINSNIEAINEWLSISAVNAAAFLEELDLCNFEGFDKTVLWKNFSQLKVWWFGDKSYSIEALSTNDSLKFHLINYGPLNDIGNRILKAGIHVSNHHIDRFKNIFQEIRERNQAALPYLRNFEGLTTLISLKFIEKPIFTVEDKRVIFKSIETSVIEVKRREEAMKSLALFSNNRGEIKTLSQLTLANDLPEMLKGWRIKQEEAAELKLDDYIANSKEDIYEQIIKSFWNDIATQDNQNAALRKILFTYIKECYTLKPSAGSLVPSSIFFTEAGHREVSFYHQLLTDLNEPDYRLLSNLLADVGIYFPQQSLLPFYKEAPFLLSAATSIDLHGLTNAITPAEAIAAIAFFSKIFPGAIKDQVYVDSSDGSIEIQTTNSGVENYYTKDKDIDDFIKKHFAGKFCPLPKSLEGLLGATTLQGEKLLARLVKEVRTNPGTEKELFLLLLEHPNDEIRQEALSIGEPISIKQEILPGSFEYLKLKLCLSIINDNSRMRALGNLVLISQDDNAPATLSGIQNRGLDTLVIEHTVKGKLSFSVNNLLGGSANNTNQILTEALEKWIHLGLGARDQIAVALGIHQERKQGEVFEALVESLAGGKIINGEQLVFLWASGAANAGFEIETCAGWISLQDTFYIQDFPFLPDKNKLTPRYNDFYNIITLGNEILDGHGWNLLARPYLNAGILHMPGIDTIEEPVRSAFCKYLFDTWEAAGSTVSVILQGEVKWGDLLGFIPAGFIMAESYALPEEQVPVALLSEWGLPISKISAFISALGGQGAHSAVVITRRFFAREGGEINTSMSLNQTNATLKWISFKKITVTRDEVSAFYRNLAGKNTGLNYFPGLVPGSAGFKIVSILDPVYILGKEDAHKLRNFELKISSVADAANVPIISLSILEDWEKYLVERTKPVEIKWDEMNWDRIHLNSSEWEFPFYREWKNSYPDLSIYKVSGDALDKMILVNDVVLSHYKSGKICRYPESNDIFVSAGDTDSLLNEIDSAGVFNPEAIKYLRQCYAAQSQQFDNFIELARNDAGFAQLLKEHAEAIRLQEERTARAEIVRNYNVKYTQDWFLNLLELVRVQEISANIPEVVFGKIERVPTAERTFELSEIMGRIPANIETFDEIPAIISYLDEAGETVTRSTKLVASEKHNKLWVTFPEAAVQPILDFTQRIVSIKLVFTRTVDLIAELKSGFMRLGYKEEASLKESLSGNIDFIFGPPGTGKTTELARQIIAATQTGVPGPTIVLTPTNKAADVLAKKIIELFGNIAPPWLLRVGSCTDPLLLREGAVKTGEELLVERDSDVVLITTIHRFPYFFVPTNRHTTDKARLCDCPWQEVIFDEASMIPLAYIAFAIHARQKANPATHFLVAGDPLQIPPVFDLLTEDLEDFVEELQEENIYTMVGLKSFDPGEQASIPKFGTRIRNLDVQHRSVPVIGELFSKFQYEGRLSHSRGTNQNTKPGFSRSLPAKFAKLGFKPITIIRYPVKQGDSIYKPQKLEGSPIHIYSALLVSELVKSFLVEVKDSQGEGWSIGVLAPYRSEADLLIKMIEAHAIVDPKTSITTDTVHGFQGDETNIVFALFNPSGNGGNIACSRFLKKEFILNVAISRAQDYLIMLIPDEASKGISGLPLINQLVELAKETQAGDLAILNAGDLEYSLMKTRNYFELKTFATAHQKVNIYGKPDLPYVIRLNDKSIDIHWDS